MIGKSLAVRMAALLVALAAVTSASALPHIQAEPVAHTTAVAYHGPPVWGVPPEVQEADLAEPHRVAADAAAAAVQRRLHRAEARARAERRAARHAALLAAQERSRARTVVASTPVPSGSWESIVEGMTDAASASCAISIFTRESGGNPEAENASGAYGIPQALPGSKMASAGPDWQTNPATQIRWGLGYMTATYGSPCAAWGFWQAHSWY